MRPEKLKTDLDRRNSAGIPPMASTNGQNRRAVSYRGLVRQPSIVFRRPACCRSPVGGLAGSEKDWFQIQIRKLKKLVLTVIHHPGYSLSARGVRIVQELSERNSPES